LIDLLLPAPPEAGPIRANADVDEFLRDVLAAVHARVRQSKDGVSVALEELHHALEHDDEAVRDAVSHYTTVLAATCGQSVGAGMREHKADTIRFDTVVVDEAARANPLDLLIPLACAERRIVLVGDHRQLAHMLEPDVEGVLNGSVEDATRQALRQSLFERLFLALRERSDWQRVVTLDRQFRMHRVLGAFVSAVFYAPHGEGFGSPRPDTDFVHEIPRWLGCVAGWIDVPLAEGPETKASDRSTFRSVEAERVAQEVAAILADPASSDLTIGVISFYGAQVRALLGALVVRGIATVDDDGNAQVAAEHRSRLRVGTVDAFQGREFDVVILSCTRSSRGRVTADTLEHRARYGHLLIENRLCVAMSRAKRLLLAVGDLAMFEGGPVAGLDKFIALCRGEHGHVR
jgi:superfamily I DNA and/or RNA helicase